MSYIFSAPWLMPAFVCMTAVFIFALPFIVVSSATLMAKFTDESQQSTIQGNFLDFITLSHV